MLNVCAMKATDRPQNDVLNLKLFDKPISRYCLCFNFEYSPVSNSVVHVRISTSRCPELYGHFVFEFSARICVYTHMDPLPINRRGNIADCRDGDESKATCSRSFIIPAPLPPPTVGVRESEDALRWRTVLWLCIRKPRPRPK